MQEANQQLLLAGLREQESSEVSETARLRAVFLAEASRLLAGVFDPDDTLQRVAELAVPTVGDFCFLDILDAHGTLQRAGSATAGPKQQALVDAAEERLPTLEEPGPVAVKALTSGEPVVMAEVTDVRLQSIATGPEHLEVLRAVKSRSMVTIPLLAGESALGTMTFGFTSQSGREYTPEALALAEDLASRAALAVESARLYRELQQAMRIREDFFGSAAHDLRTPLTTIRGRAQLLLRQVARFAHDAAGPPAVDPSGPFFSRLGPALAGIDSAAAKMARLIDALLDAARLQAGQTLQLARQPTDLVAMARHAVADHQLGAVGHLISLETEETALVGQWDAGRLDRVIDNLLGNAIKYSPDGGAVVVTVARSGNAGDASDAAILTVRDSGMGIPQADLSHLFERFHRGANVSGRIGGSGIGLADVKQIVEEHGGTITVESHEIGSAGAPDTSGTLFTAWLPLDGGPDGVTPGAPASP